MDVMTRQTLVDDVGVRGAIDVLKDVRSIVDVNVYVWQERAEEWEQLSQGDRRRLWKLRGRIG